MNPYVIGIDPGLSGALALLDESGHLLVVDDMPQVDKRVTAALLRPWLNAVTLQPSLKPVVGIELVGAMPKQGVASTFKFGAAWGVVHGAFGADHRVIDVRPQDWKATHKIHGDRDGQKEKARRLAIERWPDMAERFARKKDSGRAEAALIAEHVRQLIAGEG